MIKKIIDNIEEIICLISLSVMTLLTFANVVTRYVFNFSMNFAEEISTYMFVLLSLFGASWPTMFPLCLPVSLKSSAPWQASSLPASSSITGSI